MPRRPPGSPWSPPARRLGSRPRPSPPAWSASNRQEPSPADHKEVELVAEIRTIHRQSSGIYGSPRVHAELRRRGQRVNHKRVERLMATHGIVGHRPRRRRSLTKPDTGAPPAPDLLGRLFDPTGRMWPGVGM